MISQQSARTMTGLVLLVALVLRVLLSGQMLLVPDETYYWQWSRYLALGYQDHPPMVAWTIWLSTQLFGPHAWAVRMPAVLGLTVTSVFLCRLAAHWFSWTVALHLALLSQMLLLVNGMALIVTPDSLLLPCWAAACYHAALALDQTRPRHWVATGCWFGLGLLSKYTMVLFLPSLFMAMLVTPRFRRQFLEPWPWLGLLCGVLLMSPVVFWNSQNEWVTFRHVLYQGGAGNPQLLTLRYLADFLGSQWALLTPLAFVLILAAWLVPGLRHRLPHERGAFLLWMSLPGFVLFALLALHVRIYGNWPAPVYLTALVLIAALFGQRGPYDHRLSRLWCGTMLTAALCTLPVVLQAIVPLLPIPLTIDRTARECAGWDQLARHVGAAVQVMPRPQQTFVFGLRYQLASELAFYLPGQPRTVAINRWSRPNVYDFWFEDAELHARDGVGIAETREAAEAAAALFSRAEAIEEIRLTRTSPWFGPQVTTTLYLIRGYDFQGGLRWHPSAAEDIRATRRQAATGG